LLFTLVSVLMMGASQRS